MLTSILIYASVAMIAVLVLLIWHGERLRHRLLELKLELARLKDGYDRNIRNDRLRKSRRTPAPGQRRLGR